MNICILKELFEKFPCTKFRKNSPADYCHPIVLENNNSQEGISTGFQCFCDFVTLARLYIATPEQGMGIYITYYFRVSQSISFPKRNYKICCKLKRKIEKWWKSRKEKQKSWIRTRDFFLITCTMARHPVPRLCADKRREISALAWHRKVPDCKILDNIQDDSCRISHRTIL